MGLLNFLDRADDTPDKLDVHRDKENRLVTMEPGKGNFTRRRKGRGTPRWQIEAYIFLFMVAICAVAYAIVTDSYEWQHMGRVRRGIGLLEPAKHIGGIAVDWTGIHKKFNTRFAKGE